MEWIPTLEHFAWMDVPIYIAFDSDAETNWNVRLAETRLALRLTDRGARV
jgi:hypothetical protein